MRQRNYISVGLSHFRCIQRRMADPEGHAFKAANDNFNVWLAARP